MKLQQVSDNCFATLNERNRVAHRTLPGRMKEAADPRAFQKLLDDVDRQPY